MYANLWVEVLVPLTAELEVPELRSAAGAMLLILFFFVCWVRGLRAGAAKE